MRDFAGQFLPRRSCISLRRALVCTNTAKRGLETFRLPMQWLTSVPRNPSKVE
jgi:hypothetical protein